MYATSGTVRAIRFNLATRQTEGTAQAVVRDVVTTDTGAIDAVVADDGTLVYVPGPPVTQSIRSLVWVDRLGRETPVLAKARAYAQPRLSPDGKRVALFTADQDLDVWVWDFDARTLSRVTTATGVDNFPIWTSDSQRLIFSSQRDGATNLFMQGVGGGPVTRVTESANAQSASGLTPDGKSVIFTESSAETGEDVMLMPLDGTHRVTPLVRSPFAERNGVVSSDGQWLAYEANDSGAFEVFVQPMSGGSRSQVSTSGGTRPMWTSNGKQLFYVSPTSAIMSVPIDGGRAAGLPTTAVKEGYYTSPGNAGRTYDPSPDGSRILMVKADSSVTPRSPAQLVVVQHWDEELKRLLPTR